MTRRFKENEGMQFRVFGPGLVPITSLIPE